MWECYWAGFFETRAPNNMPAEDAKYYYSIFLSDIMWFESAMRRVGIEWPNSCEHFLSNAGMNRIAWLGQAAMCIATGVPSTFRGGFKLLSHGAQWAANRAAEKYLTEWLNARENK